MTPLILHRRSSIYAQAASESFNSRLHGILRDFTRDTLEAVGSPLVLVVLAGNFGAGRGHCIPVERVAGSGIWSHGQAPGEAMEFMVVANARPAAVRQLLGPVSRKYRNMLGVPIRFRPVIQETDLARLRPGLDWYDLLGGHQVLHGEAAVLNALSRRYGIAADACGEPSFPVDEAWWLHAWSGFRFLRVLAADEAATGSPALADLRHAVRRLGDVVLLAHGEWSAHRPDWLRALQRRLAGSSRQDIWQIPDELFGQLVQIVLDPGAGFPTGDWSARDFACFYGQAWLAVAEGLCRQG